MIAWGQTHLAAGLASILNAATPLFAVLVAHVFTAEEKLSRLKIIGTAAGMAGVAWVIGPDLLWGQAKVNAWAEGAVLLAALSYAVSAVFARRVRALGLEPLDVATGQATAGAIYLVPLALLVDQPWSLPVPSVAVVASVFAIAALCTALAYVVYFRILSGAGATNVLLVTLMAPATSVVLGALFLHERLLARQFLGFALIAIGLAFIDGRLPRALSGANPNLTPHNSQFPTGRNRANLLARRRPGWRPGPRSRSISPRASPVGAAGVLSKPPQRTPGGAKPFACRATKRAPRRANGSSASPKRPT